MVGILLPCIETWRRWRMLADWPTWLADYIAGGLLLYAWQAGRKDSGKSRPYLMAAWGYTFGIAYMSFFGQLKSTATPDPSGVAIALVIAFKGMGLVLTLTCLVLTWRSIAAATKL